MVAILTFGVASVHEAAAARIQKAQHRQPHTVQAPGVRPNGNGAYASSGLYDRSHWSPSHRPGGPCFSRDLGADAFSAYPAWEVDCK